MSEIPEGSISTDDLVATAGQVVITDETALHKHDARVRGLRTLAQSAVSGVLAYLGSLAADVALPGFELSYEALAVGVGIAVLTPVLAFLQRRAGK